MNVGLLKIFIPNEFKHGFFPSLSQKIKVLVLHGDNLKPKGTYEAIDLHQKEHP